MQSLQRVTDPQRGREANPLGQHRFYIASNKIASSRIIHYFAAQNRAKPPQLKKSYYFAVFSSWLWGCRQTSIF